METPLASTAASSDDGQLWDRARTVRLIELWSHCPMLYDSTCPDYRDKQRRSAALSAIASDLGVKDGEIRDKMRNLRSQYSREKTHETKSMVSPSMASPFGYKSRWYYFNKLSFLDEFKRSAGSDSETSCGQLGLAGISDADGTFHVQVNSHESAGGRLCDGTNFAASSRSPSTGAEADPGAAMFSSSSPANGIAEHDSLSRSEDSEYGGAPPSAHMLLPRPQAAYCCEAPRLSPEEDLSSAPRLTVDVPPVACHTGARKRKMNSRRPVRRHVAPSSCQLPCSPPENDLGHASAEADEHDEQAECPAVSVWADRATSTLPPAGKFWKASKEDDECGDRQADDCGESDDSEELFGRFIASELRRVVDLRTKALAKLRMHEALFAATARHWELDGPVSLPVAGSGASARQPM